MFENTKGVFRIRISKKVRQHNGQKKKVQKDKQRSTKHTHKTKDRVTWIPLKTGGELRCSGRVGSSCSTGGTRRDNLVTNPLISNEWGKDREVFTTSGTYPWSFVTQIFYNGQPKVVCCFWKNRHTFNLQLWCYDDANTPYLHRRRLVPNFRSIRDRYTIRYPALYILHNRARYKMVWNQFETITPGTEKWRRSNVHLLIYIHHYKEVHGNTELSIYK